MSGRVVVCGNLSLDVLVRDVSEPIGWDATVPVKQIEQHMGGNGASCAYTLGKLGIPVTLMSLAGRDPVADQLLSRLRGAGVDCRVEQGGLPTSQSVSLVDAAGRRALLYHLGASAGEFCKPIQFPEDASHFHLGAIYRMQDVRRNGAAMLLAAKQAGLSTSVDAQWDHLGEWPPAPPCDLLFVNEGEARHLRPTGAVVVKLGARGCFVSVAGEEFHAPGVPVAVVDTTGAGDCFCGAYLAELQRGKGHREAAAFANRVASLAVTALGATAALDGDQLSSL